MGGLVNQRDQTSEEIRAVESRIMEWHRANEASRRLATVPGIGPITASAVVAAVPDASLFPSGRQFAAWLGLTPKAHGSGGKDRVGGIGKQGDGYIRRLLVIGATAVIRLAKRGNDSKEWATKLLGRKPTRVVSVALATKTARIVWILLARGEVFNEAAA